VKETKRSVSIINLLFIFCIILSFANSISAQTDVIRPLPRIDKEFLLVVHNVIPPSGEAVDYSGDLAPRLEELNGVFAPIGVSFRICESRFIENWNYFDNYDSTISQMLWKYNVPDRINVYIHGEVYATAKILGGTTYVPMCGKATLTGVVSNHSGVFLKPGCFDITTIAHEFGHYFGLAHTFAGNGVENADGSNCSTTGDFICDTPADPYDRAPSDQLVDNNCRFIYMEKDANGDFYDPDVSNIMGYYANCRCLKFTQGQYEYMVRTYYQSPHLW